MVKLIADIQPTLYKRIKELIDAGEYDSIEQFIEAACVNQAALSGEKTQMVLHLKPREPKAPESEQPEITPDFDPKPEPELVMQKKRGRKTRTAKPSKVDKKVKKAIKFEDVSEEKIVNALILFRKHWSEGFPSLLLPIDNLIKEWPWGQTNRYLPLKMIVRAIANESQNAAWPRLDAIAAKLQEPCCVLGSALVQADRSADRKREQSLATALPRLEKEESGKRFVNTFLGSITPTGIFYPGGAFHYGFISKLENDIIGLTGRGLEFSKMINPILDGDPKTATMTLSDEERAWLKDYAMSLPGEGSAFKVVLEALGKEQLSPDDFAKRTAQLMNFEDDGSFRIKFNGVVSRMIELELLKREWHGTNAFYFIP